MSFGLAAGLSEKAQIRNDTILKVSISVVVYYLAVSAVPIYNKLVFSGVGAIEKFPYPLATACLQLGSVAIVLAVTNVLWHCLSSRDPQDSWILGPCFLYKLWHVAPVGILFGVKYGITNWGLQLVPTGTHLLLQSTDLMWTLLFARVFNDERLTAVEALAASLSCIGSFVVGLDASETLDAPVFALLINLCTPIVLALCITTLRASTKELFDARNRLGGSMSAIEFTALKLMLSSAVALATACALENGVGQTREAWWDAAAKYPIEGWGVMLIGTVFTLIFQVNITWLSGLTSATAVGIVGESKVVPQWLINAAFNLTPKLSPLNLIGACFAMLGSLLYASAHAAATCKDPGAETKAPYTQSLLEKPSVGSEEP
eukprot:TRINITY_DN68115_c0_g1_i1.p1 TRINITY_DN68115_c0_g1~~TRINITY_DN68115_c0_g1_i1.p1  ORF type:complete len:375 (+),score=60.94 TRINITY_DN68115_c0_g1_i1:90-1214(+)